MEGLAWHRFRVNNAGMSVQKSVAALSVVIGSVSCAQQTPQPPSVKPSPAPHGSTHATAPGGAKDAQPLDWRRLESGMLVDHVQLTSREQFVKAGEAYFSPDGRHVIFQAVGVPVAGREADPFYAMYVARLVVDAGGSVTGLEHVSKISPEGSANTCGWFHPTQTGRVLFGSTLHRPSDDQKSGFQVGTRKYVWMFPQEMEIVTALLDVGGVAKVVEPASPVFSLPNYDAECSYSKDGRFVLYAHIENEQAMGRPDANIYIYDTTTQKHHAVVTAPGYDGGPFFSPDERSICYRSDRKGDDLLQLYVADLKLDGEGVPVGIEREYALTQNQHVNWAPYWHPGGKYLVYGTSEVGHSNYEVFAVRADMEKLRSGVDPSTMERTRITHASGADVLPVFSPDGSWMMWTSQRGPKAAGEDRPSSQLWIARFRGEL